MQIIIFTARMMWERSINLKSRLWFCSLLPVFLLIITPQEKTVSQLVSLMAILPALFLLTNWIDSASRNGIVAILTRGEGSRKVRIAEWSIPALAGTILSSVTVFASCAQPPWQFWVSSALTATSFSLIFLMTEQYVKFPGRAVLSLMWLFQITKPAGKVTDILLFTGYPAAVLFSDPNTGSHHPDTFVLTSLIVLFITAAAYTLLIRRNS